MIDIDLRDTDLQRTFKALPEKLQKNYIRRAIRKAGKIVLADAKTNVPVLTGRLRDTLRIKSFSRKTSVGVKIETGTREDLGIAPDDPYFYPAVLEFGSERIPPVPFLRGSLYDNSSSIMALIRDAVRGFIAKAAAKAAKKKVAA